MATYIQTSEYHEDGYGMVKETFVVSDQHHSIFDNATIGKCEDTTVFATGGTYSGTAALTYTVEIDAVKDGSITAFADAGGGYVTATSVGHLLVNGDYVEIFGNASYNGTYVVANKLTDSFDFLKTFVASGTATFMAASFKWSNDGGATWEATGVKITKAAQTLELGITITFNAITGISARVLGESYKFSTRITANIFDISEITKGFEIDTGKLTEDELKFKINEANVKTTGEAAALQFVLDAQTVTNKRFAALFVDASSVTTFDKDNCLFSSVIRPEMKAKIIQWSGTAWATAVAPLHEWDITAEPVFENFFDYDLKECIDGILTVDADWEDDNVADRDGYFHYGDSTCKFHRLVNLTKVIQILNSVVTGKLEEDGLGTFYITLSETAIDGKFRPARFAHHTLASEYDNTVQFKKETTDQWEPTKPVLFPDDDSDIRALKIGSDDETESPWIHYGLIKHLSKDENGSEIDYQSAESYQWYKSVKTYTDLLYKIAQIFGMQLLMSYTDSTTLNIEFIPRGSFSGTQIYIVDAISDDIEVTPVKEENDEEGNGKFYGMSFGLAPESSSSRYMDLSSNWKTFFYPSYYKVAPDGTFSSFGPQPEAKGERLIMTLSVTLRWVFESILSYHFNFSFPHNSILVHDGTPKTGHFYDARGITTAIYMKVNPYGTEDGEPSGLYWTPAGLWTIDEGSGPLDYGSIADRLNRLYVREADYYQTERNIIVPSINGFSASSDGSSRTWKALSLGQQVTLDGDDYTVVQIVYDLQNKQTKLKLHNVEKYSYSDPTPDVEPDADSSTVKGNLNEGATFVLKTAEGAINRGDVVSHIAGGVTADDTIERSEATAAHYGRLLGIALATVADGERVRVQISGEVHMEDIYNLNGTGNRVYLRTNGVGINVSETMLSDKTSTEDLFAEIGTKTSKYSFKIDFKQWIYE